VQQGVGSQQNESIKYGRIVYLALSGRKSRSMYRPIAWANRQNNANKAKRLKIKFKYYLCRGVVVAGQGTVRCHGRTAWRDTHTITVPHEVRFCLMGVPPSDVDNALLAVVVFGL
jgi:hypothetical protein